MGYYGNVGVPAASMSSPQIDHDARSRIDELERRINRLELEHRVVWEMLRDGTKLDESELDRRVKLLDQRDGVRDGKITSVPLRCPSCSRVASSRHWRCLYCGQEFEKFAY
jgi:hypothetical protein